MSARIVGDDGLFSESVFLLCCNCGCDQLHS